MTDLEAQLNDSTKKFLEDLDGLPDPGSISDPQLVAEIVKSLMDFANGFAALAATMKVSEYPEPDRTIAVDTAYAIRDRIDRRREAFQRRLIVLSTANPFMHTRFGGGTTLH